MHALATAAVPLGLPIGVRPPTRVALMTAKGQVVALGRTQAQELGLVPTVANPTLVALTACAVPLDAQVTVHAGFPKPTVLMERAST